MVELPETILVVVDPPGYRAEVDEPAEAIHLARDLLERARAEGHRVPRASFYANGVLVRGEMTRTDLATDLGRCWCGRGALYEKDETPFCCAEHEALWNRMGKNQRARVIVARFLGIYGRGKR